MEQAIGRAAEARAVMARNLGDVDITSDIRFIFSFAHFVLGLFQIILGCGYLLATLFSSVPTILCTSAASIMTYSIKAAGGGGEKKRG